MIYYSVIIPQRDLSDDVQRQLPALTSALADLRQPYEILVVDDGSSPPHARLLEKLLGQRHSLRVLRLDEPCGTSVAVSIGMKAARGEIFVVLQAGNVFPPEQIGVLATWLQRADLVVGRRRRSGFAKLRERINRIPRWLLLGLDSHDPDCLFWAARREAVADLHLTAGMIRYLPALVGRRGYRVCEAYVEHSESNQSLQDVRPNPGDLLAAWWNCRRWRQPYASELVTAGSAQPALRLVADDLTGAHSNNANLRVGSGSSEDQFASRTIVLEPSASQFPAVPLHAARRKRPA